jgi:transposase
MPRTYKPRGKLRVTYSSEAMQKALTAVKTQGLTLKLASQVYGVPLSTLGKHYKEEGIIKIKGGRKTALSPEDEAAIATYLQTLSSCGEGLYKI